MVEVATYAKAVWQSTSEKTGHAKDR